jgi:heme/copper-type cytochrome/quinol oxidase subunit 3
MWLFVASLVMFLASLGSGYVLLRAGSEAWPTPWVASGVSALADPWFRLLWLVVAAGTARAAGRDRSSGPARVARYGLPLAALAGAVFFARTWAAGRALIRSGHGPASHIAPATWFALNGVLAMLVLGGVCATAAVALGHADPAVGRRRARLVARFWAVMAAAFAALAVGMYLI